MLHFKLRSAERAESGAFRVVAAACAVRALHGSVPGKHLAAEVAESGAPVIISAAGGAADRAGFLSRNSLDRRLHNAGVAILIRLRIAPYALNLIILLAIGSIPEIAVAPHDIAQSLHLLPHE